MVLARTTVTEDGWRQATNQLAAGSRTLLGLWGDPPNVHMALFDERSSETAVISYVCENGTYPSVGADHPPAIRLERAIRDLNGLDAAGLPDDRPWLDHSQQPYPFLPAEGESLHQIAVGPVHAGIIEPGHFRFTANGEHVVRLEQRLGYVHKGIEALMKGATLAAAATLAARTSGDSTVAYSYAFALAVENARQIAAPPRALYLRALMAELERLANHFGDIGAICNDASFSLMHAHCGILRERTLRAAEACFGHRLMMDAIVPGGVARDISPGGAALVHELLAEVRRAFPRLVELYDNTASLQDRTVTTGIVKPEYARQFGAGGYVGRASGRAFDARRSPGYPPYGNLTFEVPVLTAGDVDARVWIRIREVEQSLALIDQILGRLPAGGIKVAVEPDGTICEGLALVEAFRGDVLIWLRLDEIGRVAGCHLRDASWFQWPLLEAAVEGNIVADFPLCNKSFNCSYSGHDK
jgi:Ni,Fe-hydrogenase III large subunit